MDYRFLGVSRGYHQLRDNYHPTTVIISFPHCTVSLLRLFGRGEGRLTVPTCGGVVHVFPFIPGALGQCAGPGKGNWIRGPQSPLQRQVKSLLTRPEFSDSERSSQPCIGCPCRLVRESLCPTSRDERSLQVKPLQSLLLPCCPTQ